MYLQLMMIIRSFSEFVDIIGSVENGDGSNSSPVAVSIVDNESIPSVSISSDKDFIGESEEFKTATITATSDVGAGDTVRVILEKSGTATSGDDYELSSDTILILPGNSSGSITVTAKWLSENEPTEGDENIILSVSSVVGAEEDGDQSITLKITEASCDNVDKELSGSIRDDLLFLSFVVLTLYLMESHFLELEMGQPLQ